MYHGGTQTCQTLNPSEKSSLRRTGNLRDFHTCILLQQTSRLFYPATGCKGEASEGHHREVKSSTQHTRIGFEDFIKVRISLYQQFFPSLIIKKRKGNVKVESHGARQRSRAKRRQRGQGDAAIRAPTWQDVTCGEQEEETGQIQIGLVANSENISISLVVSVLIKVCILRT